MKFAVLYITLFLSSCNYLTSDSPLKTADKHYIRQLGLLEQNEEIIDFYSEFKIRNAGNFYTDKRVAKYWIDARDAKKNLIESALYEEIIGIDTVYYAGLTYSPYMEITRKDSSTFRVNKDGSKKEIANFFNGVLQRWKAKREAR